MKKIFTLLVALVATTALWAEDFEVDDIYYNILADKTNEVEVTHRGRYSTSYSNEYMGSVTIPSTVTYNGTTYSVTSIGGYAFYECSGLTSITIPNSVTSIGGLAFYNCSGLTSITIPNSVTSIRDVGFASCSGLKSIRVEDGNAKYDSRENSNAVIETATNTLIQGCQNTIIPNSVTSIGYGAFSGCSGLTSITIPNSVTSIGDHAFDSCSGLTSLTIPNSVTSIGEGAFLYCLGLASITIPNSVTSIGKGAFCRCSSLTSITIPNSVTSIEEQAFYECSGLTSITIPNSVTSIGGLAFYNCSRLTSINIFAEVPPTLGTDAFYNVSTRIPVYVPCGSVSAYQSVKGWKAFTNIQEAEYSITVGVNDNIMGTAKVDYNTCSEGAQITAIPNFGYHFVQWSDGNTDNPRTLELTQDTIFTAEFVQPFSGQCGDNLYWAYDENNKTISITGSGDMYDYTKATQPWLLFQEQITEVTTSNTTTGIGTSAFEGCIRLAKVSLGSGMGNIAANAFAGCTRLYDIYCYANPPFAEESSFANYNVYVYIPCEYQRAYTLDVIWGKFKNIECIGAESDETDGDNVTITPGSTDVTITWPTNPNAETYVIVIKQGDKVFCSLTFNADGMLLNIAFAPSRSGSHPVTYAASTGNGLRFTVTSLEESTTYGYDITTKDKKDNTLSTYTGEFTTKSNVSTSISDIQSPMTDCQKLIRDGQLIIVRDGKTYNAMGVEM